MKKKMRYSNKSYEAVIELERQWLGYYDDDDDEDEYEYTRADYEDDYVDAHEDDYKDWSGKG